MNDGQKQFMKYIIARAKPECLQEVEALLSESFGKQEAGTFDTAYLQYFNQTIIQYLKAEDVTEVVQILNQFGPQELS